MPLLISSALFAILVACATVSPVLALTQEETKRAEALIPLLEGPQEFWAIGEFVHLGPPALPVLVNALSHPSRRVRMNAIEAMYLIKDKSVLPALNTLAADSKEIPGKRLCASPFALIRRIRCRHCRRWRKTGMK